MQKRIVIADDDPTVRGALNEVLGSAGYDTVQCSNGEDAELAIREGGADLVISDVRMPGMGGLALLKRAQSVMPTPPFIMISGYASVSEAVEAMKIGAYDFIVKPFSYRELIALVGAALDPAGKRDEEEEEKEGSGGIVTCDPRMHALIKFTAEVARSHASILIQGESGTGKELLARFIHSRSRHRSGPFVAVNCAALPEGLLESELFGHERGAFTGAVVSKPGKFELAHNGTLLLDEIGEMPLPLQAKLLRVLQEREVDRVGGKKPCRVEIRVMATTNRCLRDMVNAGTFREDLFYRLNVIPLRIPTLRERIDDVEPLAHAFFANNGPKRPTLAPGAIGRLKSHPWRGNVRELFNVLERAAILAGGGTIGPEHLCLDEEISGGVEEMPSSFVSRENSKAAGIPENGEERHIQAGLSVQEMEEMLIRKTLAEVHDNRTKAARLLGISVRTLRNKIKQYQREAGSSPLSPIGPGSGE